MLRCPARPHASFDEICLHSSKDRYSSFKFPMQGLNTSERSSRRNARRRLMSLGAETVGFLCIRPTSSSQPIRIRILSTALPLTRSRLLSRLQHNDAGVIHSKHLESRRTFNALLKIKTDFGCRSFLACSRSYWTETRPFRRGWLFRYEVMEYISDVDFVVLSHWD